MGKVKDRIGGMVTHNLPYKVLSLFFALSLWAWVQTKQVVDQHTRVRLNYTWPEGMVPVEDVPAKIGVTVKGPQGLVRSLPKRALHYEVDMIEAEIGSTTVDFTKLDLWGLPEGVEVVQITKPAMEIEMDRRMEREVRIRPAVIGEIAAGWRLESVVLTPQRATVSGPRSLERKIAEVTTDVIDIGGLTKSTTIEVSLMTNHRTVVARTAEPVKAEITVSPIIVEKTFNEVPVMARAEGWRSATAAAVVTLSGNAADMRDLAAKRVSVQAHLPNPIPIGRPLKVTFDPDQPDQGLEVVHQGPQSIRVVSIEPASVLLVPSP